jgi:multidrug efflux pump subunit AcrB
MKIAGWILSSLVVAFLCLGSAVGKFVEWDGKTEMFQHLGYTQELITTIGVLEIVLALLFLIPRVSFLGAILLTGYLGGAVATHVRVGDAFYFPIIIGVLFWIGLGLRQPEVFLLLTGRTRPRSAD